MKIYIYYEFSYDLNNDGLVNEKDMTIIIYIIFEQNSNKFLGNINIDSKIDIFDLLLFSDYLYH